MDKLIRLPRFSYTSLDFDSIIGDIKDLIQEHPEYNQEWDDFLESNAGRMTVELVAFIMQKFTERADWIARELFISTATQRQSVINLLKLINHKPSLPKASKANVTMKLTQWVPSFEMPIRDSISATDINGNSINFECMEIATDGKPNYNYRHFIDTGSDTNKIREISNIPYYQGNTQIEQDVFLDGIDNEEFFLSSYPVIENSIRVISETTGKEHIQVESFVSPEAQQPDIISMADKIPSYMIEIDAQNRMTIKWGSAQIVKTPEKGEKLRIYYRTGGGKNTNIIAKGISTSKSYSSGDKRITTLLSNPNAATGGADGDDIEEEKLIAPISLRTANKTVTEEDYTTHLENDSRIMHVKAIGAQNEPLQLKEDYGYALPPLDTWLYITPTRDDWSSYSPHEYNSVFSITRPYDIWKEDDYEDINFNGDNPPDYLLKIKKYYKHNLYVTLYEEGADTPFVNMWLTAPSFIEEEHYTLNRTNGAITRITTVLNGIPSGPRILRVRYIAPLADDFKNKTIKTFEANKIDITQGNNALYPSFEIKIYNKKMDKQYVLDSDYSIDWGTGTITRNASGEIVEGETVIIYYADNYDPDNTTTEEYNLLEIIKNKKMICVDNYIKDSEFLPFDISGTVHCYKNMRSSVVENLESYMRSKYNLDVMTYDKPVLVPDIINDIMNFDGVRFFQLDYLGTNYYLYKEYILGNLSADELETLGATNYSKLEDQQIPAKYNRIYVLADDEYDGYNVIENKVHGLIFKYKDSAL